MSYYLNLASQQGLSLVSNLYSTLSALLFIINEMFKLYVRSKALVGLEGPELPAKVDFVQQENPSDESVVKAHEFLGEECPDIVLYVGQVNGIFEMSSTIFRNRFYQRQLF